MVVDIIHGEAVRFTVPSSAPRRVTPQPTPRSVLADPLTEVLARVGSPVICPAANGKSALTPGGAGSLLPSKVC